MEYLTRIDLWIIVGYMAAMLWIGYRVTDGARNVEGYTVGNRSMNGWVVGLSVLGTFLSSITFLGVPANVIRNKNWTTFAFGAALPIAAIVAVRYFIPLYRRKLNLSVYELLEQRFGYWARAYAALSYSALQMIRIAMVNLLVAIALEPLLGWGVTTTLVVVGVVVIVYDVMGGIRAVIWTDVVQVFVLISGALWCVFEISRQRPGGLRQLIADVPSGHMGFEPWASSNLALATTLVVFIYGISENLRNYGTDQNYVQRMLASRDETEAARSIWLGALAYLPLNVLFCFIGTALYVFYHVPLGGDVGGVSEAFFTPLPSEAALKADLVFPHFLRHELSDAARGIIVAGILAAAMSTVDSCMNSTSMTLFVDLYSRLRRGPGPISDIMLLRIFTAVIGITSTLLAVGLHALKGDDYSRTLMEDWWKYAGVAGSGLFGLFLLAWMLPRIPAWGAAVAVLSGIPVIVWGLANPQALHGNLVGIAAFTVMVLVGALIAAATGRPGGRPAA